MKTCTKCKETKQLTEFSKETRNRSGLRSQCKACRSIADSEYIAANPGKRKEYLADWQAANRGKVRANQAKWRAAHPDKVKARHAAYHAANYEKINASHAQRHEANPDKAKAREAKWRAAHPEACRIKCHNRRARKRENGGKLSKGLADKLFKLQRGKCACGCKQALGDNYHLDHIMPLALGGSNTDDNIQLLRQRCNNQKHAKHPVDFMQQRGFLL